MTNSSGLTLTNLIQTQFALQEWAHVEIKKCEQTSLTKVFKKPHIYIFLHQVTTSDLKKGGGGGATNATRIPVACLTKVLNANDRLLGLSTSQPYPFQGNETLWQARYRTYYMVPKWLLFLIWYGKLFYCFSFSFNSNWACFCSQVPKNGKTLHMMCMILLAGVQRP